MFKVFMSKDVLKPLERVLFSGFIGQGKKVEQFEKVLKYKLNSPYILTMNSGTSCLHIAYQMLTVKEETNEAIVSPLTCAATLTPLLANNIQPVWADVDGRTGNINVLDVERKITPRTKMIVAVHWGGNPCELSKLAQLSRKYHIPLIQDAAHALGAEYHGKSIAAYSDFTMFSLQAIKQVTTGDGGILVCRSAQYYKRAKLLRWYGIDREKNCRNSDLRCAIDIKEAGHKFHMNDINAMLGLENIKFLDWLLARHRDNAEYYDRRFKGKIDHVVAAKNTKPTYWLYTIFVKNAEALRRKLLQRGIQVSKVHARNDQHTVFKKYNRCPLPGVDWFDLHHLCIPCHYALTEQEREYVSDSVLELAKWG
ncbi:putative pyridoxal phosphate-dependent protein [Candidatus Termititenax aidoneus]|uniref:Pyridoxal phosphate-dependent protein n=1 Tax=Termititenax aidoneus TaxID=2218524 RepID=A0A388T9P8_TERA1|nr:putative pyridoxal phosphate-dependent protein [Candidatus Termititenax aidoneus]